MARQSRDRWESSARMRSLQRVCKLVTKTRQKAGIFLTLGIKRPHLENGGDLKTLFHILSGKENISEAKDFNSDSQKEFLHETDTTQWRRLHNWASWWCRPSHLQMSTKAYTKLSNTQWKNGPKTTNPVESINRQSVNEKGSSLYALLENIYTEDRAHAARLAAMQSSVTISYSNPDEAHTRRNKKGSPKRKRSSMLVSDVHDEDNWMHHRTKESTLTAMV